MPVNLQPHCRSVVTLDSLMIELGTSSHVNREHLLSNPPAFFHLSFCEFTISLIIIYAQATCFALQCK